MDCRASNDLLFLSDEKFDFDVSLSPASSMGGDDDEDEVFVCPIVRKEKCLSVNVTFQNGHQGCGLRESWSPLSGDQLEAVCQEAHKLASQLQSSENCLPHKDMETINTTTDKEFVQDAQEKLGMLSQTTSALSPIKRQTFCVQDSPMKQLPPAIQHRLLRESRPNTTLTNRTTATSAAPSTRYTTRASTSSPVAHTKAQPRTMPRGKSSLAVGVVLPSKPATPTAFCSANKSKLEKQRMQLPGKTLATCRRSPKSCSTRAESYEDLLSDSISVASDISDSSLNSSMLGKSTLGPPTKGAVRNLSGVKAPSLQGRRVTDRKNTSSSSSSVSSFNSSMSLSPAKGKLNSSLNLSVSSCIGPAPSSIGRPSKASRSRRSTVYTTTVPASSNTSRCSLSAQTRKLSDVERPKAARSTPLKKAEGTLAQPTPTKRVLGRTTSIPPAASVRLQGGFKAKVKPEALVAPTPSGAVKAVHHRDDKDISKMLKPKRLMSLSSNDSLPQKPSLGPLITSSSDCRLLQVKVRRPSALPTPVRRKMSSIPTATSQSQSPTLLTTPDSDPVSNSTSRENSCSPVPTNTQEGESTDAPEIQPFCLEVEGMTRPATLLCSPAQSEQFQNTDSAAQNQDQSECGGNLIELDNGGDSNNKTKELLLLDLPAPTLPLQEKLLIDLTNTPDLVRTTDKACTTTQLIDLSSPLIKWSPEDKKENAPLINLSF